LVTFLFVPSYHNWIGILVLDITLIILQDSTEEVTQNDGDFIQKTTLNAQNIVSNITSDPNIRN